MEMQPVYFHMLWEELECSIFHADVLTRSNVQIGEISKTSMLRSVSVFIIRGYKLHAFTSSGTHGLPLPASIVG